MDSEMEIDIYNLEQELQRELEQLERVFSIASYESLSSNSMLLSSPSLQSPPSHFNAFRLAEIDSEKEGLLYIAFKYNFS